MSSAAEKSWPRPTIVELRVLALQAAQGLAQEVDRDVDGDVAARLEQREQAGRLDAVAGAEVDQRHARPIAPPSRCLVGEDRRFGARRVVLGQLGDRLEQRRAEPVVEELRRDARAWRAASRAARRRPRHRQPVCRKRGDRCRTSCSVAVRSSPTSHLTAVSTRMQAMRAMPSSPAPRAPRRRDAALGLAGAPGARRPRGQAVASGKARATPGPSISTAGLVARGAPGRSCAQLLGHLVRAVPARDAVARRCGRPPPRLVVSPSTTRKRRTIRRSSSAALQRDDPARRRRRCRHRLDAARLSEHGADRPRRQAWPGDGRSRLDRQRSARSIEPLLASRTRAEPAATAAQGSPIISAP